MSAGQAWRLLAATAVGLAGLLAIAGSLSRSSAQDASPGPIDLAASQILNFRIADTQARFGTLEFVGGMELQSDAKRFGGFSGIRLLPDRSRFIAVSDAGSWLTGRIERDIAGVPNHIAEPTMGSLLPEDTGLLAGKFGADCEAIELVGDTAWLAFERDHRIARMALTDGKPAAPATTVFAKLSRLKLASNKGLEAMASFPDASPRAGALLAISEESLNGDGDIRGFIVEDGDFGEFAIRRDGDFAVTDADFLPEGDLLLLERSYSFAKGPAMRIRRIDADEIATGETLSGDVLLTADKAYRIDNMEGLDVSVDETGQIYVTLISDDNFSPLQRTLLLEFRLLR